MFNKIHAEKTIPYGGSILLVLILMVSLLAGCTESSGENRGADIVAINEDDATSRLLPLEIEQLSDEELRDKFYSDTPAFWGFSGIKTNSEAIFFSAVDTEEAIKLLESALQVKTFEYIGENDLFFSFKYVKDTGEKNKVNVFKNDVFFTNLGLGENSPTAFKDRPSDDSFPNPSKDIIKKVYDTLYDDSYAKSLDPGGDKVLASDVQETDKEYLYVLYRILGNNSMKDVATEVFLQKMVITIDKATGKVLANELFPIKTVKLK